MIEQVLIFIFKSLMWVSFVVIMMGIAAQALGWWIGIPFAIFGLGCYMTWVYEKEH